MKEENITKLTSVLNAMKKTRTTSATNSLLRKIKMENNKFYVVCALVLATLLTIIFVSLMFLSIEVEGSFTCNSGFVGLDFEAYNNIQNKTCEEDGNFTCFKDEMLFKHIKIKNIDGLNCYGEGKTKMPLIVSLMIK